MIKKFQIFEKYTDDDIISYKSEFNKDFDVFILFPKEEDLYNKLLDIKTEDDIAFTMTDRKIILIDGEAIKKLPNKYIKFIEAHEIAHHILKHKQGFIPDQEKEADYLALELLKKHGYNDSAKLVVDLWKDRHGEEIDLNEK